MTRTTYSIAALLLLTCAGLLMVPPAAATAPASLDCEVTFTPDSSYSRKYLDDQFGGQNVAVLRNGNLVLSQVKSWAGTSGAPTFHEDEQLTALSKTCNLLWQQSYLCPGTGDRFDCHKDGITADPSGNLWAYAGAFQVTGAGSPVGSDMEIQHINGATGFVLPGTGVGQTAASSGCAASITCRVYAGTSWWDGADIIYAANTQGGRMITASDSALLTNLAGFGSSLMRMEAVAPNVALTNTGANPDLIWKLNPTSLATQTFNGPTYGSQTFINAMHDGPRRSQVDSTKALWAYNFCPSGGGACTATPSYISINNGTWAQTAQFNFGLNGLVPNSYIRSWDLDGADDFLMCMADGQIMAGRSATNLLDWTTALPGTYSAPFFCRFDYNGGFWVVGGTGCGAPCTGIYARHYSGGGFIPPHPVTKTVQLYNATSSSSSTTTATQVNDVGTGLKGFMDDICGTSTSAQFLCGLMLMAVSMLVMAAAVRSVTGSGVAAGLTAGIIGLGMSIFNVIMELWQFWVAAVLILLCGGIMVVLMRSVFFGSGNSGGA